MRRTRASPAIDAMTIDQCRRPALQHVSCRAANTSSSALHKIRLAHCNRELKLGHFPFDSCAPAHFDLSVCPSMSLASPRLHSLVAYPSDFAFYVANPANSIHTNEHEFE
jgi:hypothetical protein